MGTPRPLTADEQRAFTAARLVALEYTPYFAHVLFAVRPLALEGLGTFAVDASWRLYMDPSTLTAWGPQTSGAVLVHEVGHLVRDHAGRASALGRVDHRTWNIAADAAINDDLIRLNVPLPEGVVTPEGLGLDPNGIEETYYAALVRTAPPTPAPAPGEGCGSGAGQRPAPWELPANHEANPGVTQGEATIVRRQTAHAVSEHAKARGNLPGGLRRWAEAELAPSIVPWRRVLAGAVRAAAMLTAGRTTYTYSRPSRRRLPGIILPAMRAPKVRAAVVIDTSGSMSPSDLAAAMSEIDGVVKGVGGAVDTITCDAQTGSTRRVRSAADVKLVGGGGTDMRVGITAAESLREKPDVIVVLTDGFTPWPDAPTRGRLVAVIIGNDPRPAKSTPTWATTVTVPSAA